MRRVLTILTALALLLASLCVGVFTADLPFWRRAFDLPLAPGESYAPTVVIGMQPAGAVPAVVPAENSLDPAALDAAAELARAAGAEVLLVAHRGRLQLARSFGGADDASALHSADFLARPLVALAVGIAHHDGKIESLDDAVSKYLPEWKDEPRGAITVRQLLDETSGLRTGPDAAEILASRPFADWEELPRFATSRGVRLLLGSDYESTALRVRLEHEPGGFFNVSPVNTQLAAVIVQRVTATSYENFLADRLLGPARSFHLEMQMDRRSGMPAAHCCLRWGPRDALHLVELLRTDGEFRGEHAQYRAWPAGWVAEMLKGSRANPEFGLQVGKSGAVPETWHLGNDQGGGAWIVPAEELSIVLLAPRDAPVPRDLVATVLGALRK